MVPLQQKSRVMLTKEEVSGIVAYCAEKKISYKQRLDELGIPTWKFYDSKRKFAPQRDVDNAGEFLQLLPGESFLANPIKPSRSRSGWQKDTSDERSDGYSIMSSVTRQSELHWMPTESQG